MRRFLSLKSAAQSFLVLAFLGFLPARVVSAAEIAYQGTHILTHGAFEELAKAFEKKFGVVVFVKGGGCSDGLSVVWTDRREMGGICCPLDAEKAKLMGLVSHRVAVDVKTAIVHPTNAVNNLSVKQLAEMHSGRITNWRDVGGPNKPIALVYRDHCRDMDEPVRRLLGITGPVTKKAIIVQTDKEIVDYVERFPNAIGVVSRVFAEEAKVKIETVNGVVATPENAEKKRYPLTGDLFVITKAKPGEWTDRFLDFALSEEGQSIIGKRFARIR